MVRFLTCVALMVALALPTRQLQAEGRWEVTPASEDAAAMGLAWLARNQGKEGNWGSQDLGLVSLGALAFLSAGHSAETGKYRQNVRKALNYVIANAKPSGLLNISGSNRDMYNHGLSTFVLTQAYGMSNDKRVGQALRKALTVIVNSQCGDGGWDYTSVKKANGHDLSIAVMQAKALRGAMDIGIHIPAETVTKAVTSVQNYYRKSSATPDALAARNGWQGDEARYPGRFTYNGGGSTTAMAAAGAVCLQEFGKYGDFRIYRSMQAVLDDIANRMKVTKGRVPFDAYTMYYVSQALYQVGGKTWQDGYPKIRKALVDSQNGRGSTSGGGGNGSWAGGRVGGTPGQLFGTAVAVFTLNIPNRYLPILQEGKKGVSSPRRGGTLRTRGDDAPKAADTRLAARGADGKSNDGAGRTDRKALTEE